MTWFQAPVVTMPNLVALHGKWRGARTALIEGDRRLTWLEFERETARAANGLEGLGVRDGDRVAVLMDSSLEMLILLFGILRHGGVAVPLNVSISDGAVARMIEDANARAIFASGPHCRRIDALRATSERIAGAVRVGLHCATQGWTAQGWTEFNAWLGAQSPEWQRIVAPEQDCNIIYSSGTTGQPKGIVHTHACRMQWAADLASVLRYRGDCVTLCSLGLFSNITWVAMLCTVFVGGTLVVMPHFDAAAAVELIADARVSHGTFVPLQLERLLALPDLDRHDLTSLDTLMCCGSPLPLDIKRDFPRRFDCRLIELYGLTEGVCTILAPEDFERKISSVGKPFLGTDLRIIGEDDREVPRGETGEIVGSSPLLMAGYHGNDAASSEVTWTDPHGARWLRTGDIGRLDSDGFLYVVDRKKDMILSGGQNIYPADIEAVMRAHPGVADVAVVGVRSLQWGETPVAVVVAAQNPPLVAESLVEWTNARVGKQQRIRGVVFRASLPRNANGKVLKRELRHELADLVH
ncbi:MAG TPA: class I adenylate-forming enzyme family protein [Steroidobacteraceae bacterium]|nr:class I adenylate-forming enzyme family protein [Steroidobacteraceae bacterium]